MSRVTIDKENPVLLSNEKMESLDNAYRDMLTSLEELSKNTTLSRAQLEYITKIISEAYLKKKGEYFWNDRISSFSEHWNRVLTLSLKNVLDKDKKNEDKDMYDSLYIKHTKHSLT